MKHVKRMCVTAGLIALAAGGVLARGTDGAPGGAAPHTDVHALAAVRTVAESSEYASTALHADVVRVVDAIAAAAPDRTRRASMGKTFEGRDLPLLIISDPPVATAAEARALAEKEGRVICFLFGNIHAGEVDGKEGLPMLARDLLLHDDENLLKRLVIVMAPIYNADGNERVGPLDVTRPGQNGPSNGAGQRHNAQDLDLNRDYIKLEAPETRAMVRLFNEWDPQVVVDCHTTDGSYHRYLITYAGPKVPASDPRLIEFSRDTLFPALTDAMIKEHGIDTYFYGDFEGLHENPPRGHSKWETFPAHARYSTGYVGLRGRLSILSEAYSYATLKERVEGTRDFCREILRYSADHAKALRDMTRNADACGAGKGEGAGSIALRSSPVAAPGKVRVKGWVEETRNGRSIPTKTPQEYEVDVMNRFESTLSVARPMAYALRADLPKVVENLRMHGVHMETLDKPRSVDAEVYTIDSAKAETRLFQGHALLTVEATPNQQRIELPAGTVLVPMDQPLGTLAGYMLEPECEDGLTTWNFFDDYLKPGSEFPVVRVMKP